MNKDNQLRKEETLKHCITVVRNMLDTVDELFDQDKMDEADKVRADVEQYMLDWIQTNYIEKKAIRKHFEQGHGGGNWRRLLTQLLDE